MPAKTYNRRRTARADKPDVYQEVTDIIVAALEKGRDSLGKWRAPWHNGGADHIGGGALPVNQDGRPYSGTNIPLLWCTAINKGYNSNVWGTYEGWKAKGAQVRKGEKASVIVRAGKFLPKPKPGEKPEDVRPIPYVRLYPVFNANQCDNVKTASDKPAELPANAPARLAACERFFDAIGIDTRHGGNRAYYVPALDSITLPHIEQFADAGAYYATRGHECIHATGHKARLSRDFSGRFGSQSYAFEELIAEMGAAFTCARLGIDNEPRPDHAQYLAGWLEVLENDKRAIFTASRAAQAATDWLFDKAGAAAPVADSDDDSDSEAETLDLAA